MFRKYERTFRIKIPQFEISSKHFHSKTDTRSLLTGKVLITEKIDGANVAIGRKKQDPGFFLQKRGSLVGASEHAQFNSFVGWAHSRIPQILEVPQRYIVYGEYMYATHHIFYDRLPDLFIVFNVWDKEEEGYMGWPRLQGFCQRHGFLHVPVIYYGPAPTITQLADYIPKVSAFSSDKPAEGVVVTNYKKQLRGKVVRLRFMDELDDQGSWWDTELRRNKVVSDFNRALLEPYS